MNEQPLFSSMHTHTLFCDGQDDVETMCRAAYEKKLYAIGFSSHAPVYKQTGMKTDWNMSEERIDEYIAEINAAKRRWQGKLTVFLGLEADYIKGMRSPSDSDIKNINADYIIGSVHYIVPANGAQPFTVDGPLQEFVKGLIEGFNGDGEALMHCYYDAVAEMIATGGFDILGHADIIKKNCINKSFWPAESELCRQKEIAYAVSGKRAYSETSNIAVEVNTGGINRKKINDVYPSFSFLRFLRECEIPVIITSDAHCAQDIDGNYNKALDALVHAGFMEHVLFYGKKNGNTIWKKVKIL
ncbi:MAG: histidinol-phosphatase [Treponema sp.]|nr:histidinol-phosphatase [Treponema sp.]